MKYIVVFYFLFTITFFSADVFAYTIRGARSYNLLRKPMNKMADPFLPALRNEKDRFEPIDNHKLISAEEEDNIQVRDNWDSGEDNYFQWANQNRRPVEYLLGRRREVNPPIVPERARRIGGGLWRSGLVG